MLNHQSSILIYVLIFLVILLVAFIIYLPRLLRQKDYIASTRSDSDVIAESFNMLGHEMKSLREQLIMKEKLANLGELSAGIAHELRNPMSVIMGYSKLLLKSFDETDNRRQAVQAIITEIDTMNGVMEELLKFSKSEALNKTRVDLARMIDRAVRESIKPDAVNFVSAGGIKVECDETLLRQALKNLINNALEADGAARIDIREGCPSGKKGIFIEVSDNGKGISQDEIKKIFSPFYSTKESGLGIGLSLVQKIALAHGAPAEVSSIEGKGSTFRIFLAY